MEEFEPFLSIADAKLTLLRGGEFVQDSSVYLAYFHIRFPYVVYKMIYSYLC